MRYIYIQTESGLWTVGFYRPDGIFEPESDWSNDEEAAERVHWLNGGEKEKKRNIEFQTAIQGVLENYFDKVKIEELYGYEVGKIAFDIYKITKEYIEWEKGNDKKT